MDTENKSFFNNLKERIGIEFSVYNAKKERVLGEGDKTLVLSSLVADVLTDQEKGKTIVKINLKGEDYYLVLAGAGKSFEAIANLIIELAGKNYASQLTLSQSEFYKALLHGELSMVDVAKYMRRYSVKDGTCSAMVIYTEKIIEDVLAVVSAYTADSKDFTVNLNDNSIALVKYFDDASGDYRSIAEYADYVVQSVFDELGDDVLVAMGGTVKNIFDVAISFSQASTALRLALVNNTKTGVHTFNQYILYRILEDMPRYKLNEYMKQLNEAVVDEIFSDEEMLATAEEFLDNSLNQSETARKLFLHRNTLNYRLDKIEKSTGLNIRKFSDAVTFRLITVIRQLFK